MRHMASHVDDTWPTMWWHMASHVSQCMAKACMCDTWQAMCVTHGMPCVNMHGSCHAYIRSSHGLLVGARESSKPVRGVERRRGREGRRRKKGEEKGRKGKEEGRKGKDKGKKKREEERGGREEKERGRGRSVAQ